MPRFLSLKFLVRLVYPNVSFQSLCVFPPLLYSFFISFKLPVEERSVEEMSSISLVFLQHHAVSQKKVILVNISRKYILTLLCISNGFEFCHYLFFISGVKEQQKIVAKLIINLIVSFNSLIVLIV